MIYSLVSNHLHDTHLLNMIAALDLNYWTALYASWNIHDVEDVVSEFVRDADNIWIIFTDDHEYVGYVGTFTSKKVAAHYGVQSQARFVELFVVESCRGNGVGRAAMHWLLNHTSRYIYLFCLPNLEAFYSEYGFVRQHLVKTVIPYAGYPFLFMSLNSSN